MVVWWKYANLKKIWSTIFTFLWILWKNFHYCFVKGVQKIFYYLRKDCWQVSSALMVSSKEFNKILVQHWVNKPMYVLLSWRSKRSEYHNIIYQTYITISIHFWSDIWKISVSGYVQSAVVLDLIFLNESSWRKSQNRIMSFKMM